MNHKIFESAQIEIENLKKCHVNYLDVFYSGQCKPQSIYLTLFESGQVEIDYSSEVGGGVDVAVWHGRDIRFELQPHITTNAAIKLLQDNEILELLSIVYEGNDIDWNGNNYVGKLSEVAFDANFKLQRILETYFQDYNDFVQDNSNEDITVYE